MNKEVGKIEDDRATFLKIIFDIDIINETINSDVNYDTRVIKNKEKLKNLIINFVKDLGNCTRED